jgi:hypothetical protein
MNSSDYFVKINNKFKLILFYFYFHLNNKRVIKVLNMVDIPEDKMRTMDISFCSKVATNIVLGDAKQLIIDYFKELISDNSFFGNSGYRYANIINSKSISYLSKQPHIISLKTGGANYFLFMTRINGVNKCLFIDRKTKKGYTLPRIITANFRFSDEVFDGTVLDGELVRDKKDNWMFLLSNIIAYKGENVSGNIATRFNKMYEMLDKHYKEDPHVDICYLRVKKLFTYNDYDKMMLQYIPKCGYEIKGFYFNSLNPKLSNHLFMYPNNTKERKGVKGSVVNDSKPKEPVTPQATFIIKTTDKPDIYNLYCMEESQIKEYGIAYIGKMKTSKMLKTWFRENTEKDCLVCCEFNTRFSKWEVKELSTGNLPSEYSLVKKLE